MMWSVFLPIAAPGLVAAGIFSFMTAWNEFLIFQRLIVTGLASGSTR
jgi:ABC-type glycerol-3-phosphate transport system permease component